MTPQQDCSIQSIIPSVLAFGCYSKILGVIGFKRKEVLLWFMTSVVPVHGPLTTLLEFSLAWSSILWNMLVDVEAQSVVQLNSFWTWKRYVFCYQIIQIMTSKMAAEAWQPEFLPGNPQGVRRELNAMHWPLHVHSMARRHCRHMHLCKHTNR